MAQKTAKRAKTSEYLTKCSECDEDYSQKHPPITLPCGHNICRPCTVSLRRRSGMIKCPVDSVTKKASDSQINIDFLDFIELIRAEKLEVPSKRRRENSQHTQCDSIRPEENYESKLIQLKDCLLYTSPSPRDS